MQYSQGKFIFQNNTSSDILLPKVTFSGKKLVSPGENFEGDKSFFDLVGRGLIFVKEIQAPLSCSGDQLLTEQPPTITDQGKIEHVINHSNTIKEVSQEDRQLLLDSVDIEIL